MRFYNSYSELGEKTLVYVGLNAEGKPIIEYTVINNEGVLEKNKGIVADRSARGGRSDSNFDEEAWGWMID